MSRLSAMVLAAGRGERLRPLTDSCPKPLIPVAGKPLIEHALDRLQAAGVQHCVINLSWLGEMIQSHLESQWRWEMSVDFSPEPPERLETGGGIQRALPQLGDQPFFVVNADVYSDFDFASLAGRARHWPADQLAHLVLVDNPDHHPQGDFELSSDGRIQAFGQGLTFAGLSLLHPQLFASFAPGRFALVEPLKQALERGQLSGEHYRGLWTDVGTPERLQSLRQRLGACD